LLHVGRGILAHFKRYQAGFAGAAIENKSQSWDLLALQGPNSRSLLNKLTDRALDFLRFFQFAELSLAGIPVILSRTGYTGELGFEIFVKPQHAIFLYEKILKTGEGFGILPVGLGARDTLRLEMGMILYGNDLSENRTPIEASLAWCTKPHKGDFLGRETIIRQMELGTSRKLVGMSMVERGIPRHGYRVMDGSKEIGEVTSGSFSPMLNLGIALAYIDSSVLKAQTQVGVEIRDKIMSAKVVKIPFIKPNPSYRSE
jgi:aminomethyltransferase